MESFINLSCSISAVAAKGHDHARVNFWQAGFSVTLFMKSSCFFLQQAQRECPESADACHQAISGNAYDERPLPQHAVLPEHLAPSASCRWSPVAVTVDSRTGAAGLKPPV